jgi:hypothetical protein
VGTLRSKAGEILLFRDPVWVWDSAGGVCNWSVLISSEGSDLIEVEGVESGQIKVEMGGEPVEVDGAASAQIIAEVQSAPCGVKECTP